MRHAFEALQLAERNAEKLEESELLQTLGAFLNSGIIHMPPAAEAGARRNRAGTPQTSTLERPTSSKRPLLLGGPVDGHIGSILGSRHATRCQTPTSRCRQLRVHRVVAHILRNRLLSLCAFFPQVQHPRKVPYLFVGLITRANRLRSLSRFYNIRVVIKLLIALRSVHTGEEQFAYREEKPLTVFLPPQISASHVGDASLR